MTEEKAKSLIGRKVRGFKFEGSIGGSWGYDKKMDKHIGEIGEIGAFCGSVFRVFFKNDYWYYPASLIEAHLVGESVGKRISELEKSDLNIDCMEIVSRTDYNKQDLIKVQDIINQNEQLKAENAKLVDALKMLYEETEDYISETACGNAFLDLARNKSRELIEKHGK